MSLTITERIGWKLGDLRESGIAVPLTWLCAPREDAPSSGQDACSASPSPAPAAWDGFAVTEPARKAGS